MRNLATASQAWAFYTHSPTTAKVESFTSSLIAPLLSCIQWSKYGLEGFSADYNPYPTLSKLVSFLHLVWTLVTAFARSKLVSDPAATGVVLCGQRQMAEVCTGSLYVYVKRWFVTLSFVWYGVGGGNINACSGWSLKWQDAQKPFDT